MTDNRHPVVMAIDEDVHALSQVRHELEKRYGADYEVVCESSPTAAVDALREMRDRDHAVALVLADLGSHDHSGPQLLVEVAELHPTAKRALLITPWTDRAATMSAMVTALGRGWVDYFVIKPSHNLREQFHRAVTEFLEEWARAHTTVFEAVRMVGDAEAPRTRELLDLLQRNNVPARFLAVDSPEAGDLLDDLGLSSSTLPILVLFDGTLLIDPSLEAMAEGLGARAALPHDRYDVIVVGAGPAGLGAAVYGSSEGLRTLVVEREAMGGQAGTTSLIRNYLGFPRGLSGSELAQRAYEQAVMFGTEFDFGREVTGLTARDGDKVVALADGTEIRTRAVIIGAGVSYRRLGLPSLDSLIGRGVFYGSAVTEAQAMRGRTVFVVGGGNSAGQAAVHLARYAAQTTLLVRGESLRKSMSEYLIKQIDGSPNIDVRPGTRIADAVGRGRLEGLVLETGTSGTETVAADGVFIFIGARPRTEWLAKHLILDSRGYIRTGGDLLEAGRPPAGWPLTRPPMTYETSIPGVFAAGDVRDHSVKRVASAVGEGAAALQACHTYFESRPD